MELIDHDPTRALDQDAVKVRYADTLRKYEAAYGSAPEATWPRPSAASPVLDTDDSATEAADSATEAAAPVGGGAAAAAPFTDAPTEVSAAAPPASPLVRGSESVAATALTGSAAVGHRELPVAADLSLRLVLKTSCGTKVTFKVNRTTLWGRVFDAFVTHTAWPMGKGHPKYLFEGKKLDYYDVIADDNVLDNDVIDVVEAQTGC